MFKPYVLGLGLLISILIVLSAIQSAEARGKRMIIGFSGGRSGAINGHIKQNGELPTNEEIAAAIKLAQYRIEKHKRDKSKAQTTSLGTGGRVAFKIR